MQWYAATIGVSTAGNGYSVTPWTLDQVKYLFLSVDDWDGWDKEVLMNTSEGSNSWSAMSSTVLSRLVLHR